MSSKEVYSEFFTKEEYEKELEKTLTLGCVEHALLFYQFCRYCTLNNEEFISVEKYYELCDFLTDNLLTLPKGLQEYVVYNDVLAYDCNLEIAEKPENWVKGKHLLTNIKDLLVGLEDRIEIDYSLKVIEEVDCTY